MANPHGFPTKKSLYSILPDRPDNLANIYRILSNVVAAGDWDTAFANAQLFATLPRKRQKCKIDKYRPASEAYQRAWRKVVCKLHNSRPGSETEDQGGDEPQQKIVWISYLH